MAEFREKATKSVKWMAINDIPAIKAVIRTNTTKRTSLMAVWVGQQLKAEQKLVEKVVFEFWVERVFRQHPETDDMPRAPEGYGEFVQGQHAA